MAKEKTKTLEQERLQEEVAKRFLISIPWESAPTGVKNQCMDRAKELLEYLDSQGARLPHGARIIWG